MWFNRDVRSKVSSTPSQVLLCSTALLLLKTDPLLRSGSHRCRDDPIGVDTDPCSGLPGGQDSQSEELTSKQEPSTAFSCSSSGKSKALYHSLSNSQWNGELELSTVQNKRRITQNSQNAMATSLVLWKQGSSSCWRLCSENQGKGQDLKHDAPSKAKGSHSPLHRDGTTRHCSLRRAVEMLNNQSENSRSPKNELLQIKLIPEHHVLAQESIFIFSSKMVESGNLGMFQSFCFILWDIHLHTHTHIPMTAHTLAHSHVGTHTCTHSQMCLHTHPYPLVRRNLQPTGHIICYQLFLLAKKCLLTYSCTHSLKPFAIADTIQLHLEKLEFEKILFLTMKVQKQYFTLYTTIK